MVYSPLRATRLRWGMAPSAVKEHGHFARRRGCQPRKLVREFRYPSIRAPWTIELVRVHANQVPTTMERSGILAGVGAGTIDSSRDSSPREKCRFCGGSCRPVLRPPHGASKLGRPADPPFPPHKCERGGGTRNE